MKRYIIQASVLGFAMLLLAGCWSRRELNELAIAVAMGIDKVENEYQITVQVVEPSQVASGKGGGDGRSPVTTYQANGKTEIEAIRKMTMISPRRIYTSHLRMLVIGEEVAKAGIKNTLDFLSRGQEFRTDFNVVVTKGTRASQILKILTPTEKIPANKMFSSLNQSEIIWGPTSATTLIELLSDIVKQGKQPVLTGIQVIGNAQQGESQDNISSPSPPTQIGYRGYAVFRNNKLVGWLNEKESNGYNFVVNNIKSSIVNTPCPQEGHLAFEIIHSSTELNSFLRNKKPSIKIEIRTEGNISEVNCSNLNITKTEVLEELENNLEQEIKKDIEHVINISQKKMKSDIFGFGEVIHRSHLSYWEQVRDDWEKIFANLPVDINVDLKIRRIGTVSNPL
ncbi:Ger(x)C family spore germination protein [Ammoniphilus sp. 3BR4]|uniref:Ger(x)C family spore germination protein n=1 Tax=Ammoniphilus sp. 3BR4 TaxID=3158265 RepID=UPI00346550D2